MVIDDAEEPWWIIISHGISEVFRKQGAGQSNPPLKVKTMAITNLISQFYSNEWRYSRFYVTFDLTIVSKTVEKLIWEEFIANLQWIYLMPCLQYRHTVAITRLNGAAPYDIISPACTQCDKVDISELKLQLTDRYSVRQTPLSWCTASWICPLT